MTAQKPEPLWRQEPSRFARDEGALPAAVAAGVGAVVLFALLVVLLAVVASL